MVMRLGNDNVLDGTIQGECQDATTCSSGTAESPEAGSSENLLGVDKLSLDDVPANNHRKMALLYALLFACVADKPVLQEEEDRKSSRFRKGYDSRHHVALRLLATWLDVKWIKMESIEVMVACSAMAAAKEQAQENASPKSKWKKWKRGGIIGAAALIGGALLAITGGRNEFQKKKSIKIPYILTVHLQTLPQVVDILLYLTGLAAPAIAAGFGALAPTLGTLVPFIGASGFAAMAAAAGSVAGSVAVASSFGAAGAGLTGSKMARRSGSVKEFEFKPIGDNHNQGMVAGRFVNLYSRDDCILGVTFRASLLTQGLAGIQAIDLPGVENVDVAEHVDGHSSYLSAAQQILEHLE